MVRPTTEAPVANTGPPLMTAMKLPEGTTFVEHVSHNAFPPWLGQGDQFPDPPLHVDVVCARAGTLTTPTNARAITAIRNREPTDFAMSLERSIFIKPPSFIAVGPRPSDLSAESGAKTPHSYCITYCTLTKTSD